MMTPARGFMLFGMISLFTFGSQLAVRLVAGHGEDPGSHWTHAKQPLSLAESADRVQIKVGDTSLPQLIEQEQLRIAGDNGKAASVAAADVTVRVNTWPERKAEQFMAATYLALMTGVGLGALLAGLVLSRIRPNGCHGEQKTGDGGQSPGP